MASLHIEWPPNEKTEVPLDGERITVGRAPENGICLDSLHLSAMHAEFQRVGASSYVLSDLGSANGTFVNGIPATQDTKLAEGDRIRFGLIAAEIRGLAAGGERAAAGPELLQIQAELAAANREVESLRQRLEEKEGEQDSAPQLAAARQELDTLLRDREAAQGDLTRIRAEADQAKAVLTSARDLLRQTETRCGELQIQVSRLSTEERSLTGRLQMLHRQQFAAEKRLQQLESGDAAAS